MNKVIKIKNNLYHLCNTGNVNEFCRLTKGFTRVQRPISRSETTRLGTRTICPGDCI